MRWQIEQFIHEDVRSDIHGDLYGVERAADAIVNYIHSELITRLKEEAKGAVGSYVDGLYEAIDVIENQFKEKSNA
jgi:hypothetical protein